MMVMVMVGWIVLIVAIAWGLASFRAPLLVWTVLGGAALALCTTLRAASSPSLIVLWVLFAAVGLSLNLPPLRRALIGHRIFAAFRHVMPPMSNTEREALDAGTVWWEAELFRGDPDWQRLLALPPPQLSQDERAFLDGPVEELCRMLDDWDVTQKRRDLPPDVWRYIKEKGFFGMIIPKKYGGLEFSAQAHSAVVVKTASRSLTAAVTMMVPNSLGPAELLIRYGTDAQRDYYLPRLARGEDVPCFALTSPEAGSDASSIPERGFVCRSTFEGRNDVLGIRVTWEKRYITLGPVATLLGLAFRLFDPEHLLGKEEDIGITLALIPTTTPGVHIGTRHNPLNIPFKNGPNWYTMSATRGASMISSARRQWRVEIRNDIAWLTIAVADQSVNVLGREVLLEFDQILSEIHDKSLKGVVIRSARESGFIAGADIREFEHIDDPAVAADLARTGQRILGRLAALPFPSVAAVHGFCLGGGLELALACTYRVARDDADTRFGLPEVRLGINPGFAGTIRLPRLIGDLPALEMLTGRTVGSIEGRRIGLADDVVPERHLLRAAEWFIRENPGRRRAAWIKRLPSSAPFRPLVVKMLTRRVARQAHPEHYPAPYRILELWKQQATEEQEAISLGELLVSRTSRNLVHVFLIGEELKRHGRASQHGIRNVHVVGAGTMGGDIAMWAASKGFNVTLQDQEPDILARAMKRAYDDYKKRLEDPRAVRDAMDRLMPDLAGNGLTRADLVIEAIVEKVEAKQSLFRDVERRVPKGALLATNTWSIPLETIAQGLSDPSRLVGLHFFNPVVKMQLVEIVRGAQSSEAGLARARSFTAAIDRLPLDVKSGPGFLVNRILMPYLLEAVKLAEEGAALEQIDDAATTFGMPMGPIELADIVGIDICLSVAQFLSGPLGVEVPKQLADKVAAGKLGKKSGEGFYRWDSKGRPVKPPVKRVSHMPVTERLILRLLNEAVACLREGVVKNPDDVDAGMVYGIGFAPFLGGPMRYIASLGETDISHRLYRLSQDYDKRFTPDPGWSQLQSLTSHGHSG